MHQCKAVPTDHSLKQFSFFVSFYFFKKLVYPTFILSITSPCISILNYLSSGITFICILYKVQNK